ncbi:hypothetical protein ACSQ67_025002 [Phaseolus vulgaris]
MKPSLPRNLHPRTLSLHPHSPQNLTLRETFPSHIAICFVRHRYRLKGRILATISIVIVATAVGLHVSIFFDENEALSTIWSSLDGFHVAIVELGAVEFLSKPLSEDKLQNIWQHVVHKAFNAGANAPNSNEQDKTHKRTMSIDLENVSRFGDDDKEQSACDKYPTPSTPQLKHGTRLLDDGDCHEHTNFSTEKESGEHDGEWKSVEASCENLNAESSPQPIEPGETLIKEEEDFANGSKCEIAVSPNLHNEKFLINADDMLPHPHNGSITSSQIVIIMICRKL